MNAAIAQVCVQQTKEVSGLFGIDITDLNRSAGHWLCSSLSALQGLVIENGEKCRA